MLKIEDFRYDADYELFANDDTQDVTCRMCNEDCQLSCITDGLCPDCFSLCASAPTNTVDALTRRAHLVSLTRRAFLAYSEATALYQDRVTALRPSRDCIEEADLLAKHRLRRFSLLETRLADESGLSKASVFNSISLFVTGSRLLSAGL